MDIHGFRRINDGEESAAAWQQEVESAEGRGLTLTTLDVTGARTSDSTGEHTYESVTVRDARTNQRIAVLTPDEFSTVNYDIEGWFDANGPYEPQG